jgi:hypothetical protein
MNNAIVHLNNKTACRRGPRHPNVLKNHVRFETTLWPLACLSWKTRKEVSEMARNLRVKGTLEDAEKVATVWKENPKLVMGDLKYSDFDAIRTAADEVIKDCLGREAELVGLKKERDDQLRKLQDLVSRFRSVVRAHFGPDSKEYAQAGGTPASARRSRSRKPEPAPQPGPVQSVA